MLARAMKESTVSYPEHDAGKSTDVPPDGDAPAPRLAMSNAEFLRLAEAFSRLPGTMGDEALASLAAMRELKPASLASSSQAGALEPNRARDGLPPAALEDPRTALAPIAAPAEPAAPVSRSEEFA